jgi:hypothetical protein
MYSNRSLEVLRIHTIHGAASVTVTRFDLLLCGSNDKAPNTNFIVFVLTQPVIDNSLGNTEYTSDGTWERGNP